MKLVSIVAKKYGIVIGIAVVFVALSFAHPTFLTVRNLRNIVLQTSIQGVMAVGMTFVIVARGIDLSVGSGLALAGVMAAGFEHLGLSVPLIIIATLGVGAGVGLVNGLIITIGKVTPFVVTLGMMSVARGAALLRTGGHPISGFERSFRYMGAGSILNVPVPIWIFIGTVVAATLVLSQTRFGRYLYAIGGNEEATKLSGINVDFYKVLTYMISGGAAALGALILTARLNAGEPIAGRAYELDVIAAVVIGGTRLMGGRGTVIGSALGALLVGMIANGLNLMGVSAYFQLVIQGSIIVGAVLLDRLREQD